MGTPKSYKFSRRDQNEAAKWVDVLTAMVSPRTREAKQLLIQSLFCIEAGTTMLPNNGMQPTRKKPRAADAGR